MVRYVFPVFFLLVFAAFLFLPVGAGLAVLLPCFAIVLGRFGMFWAGFPSSAVWQWFCTWTSCIIVNTCSVVKFPTMLLHFFLACKK